MLARHQASTRPRQITEQEKAQSNQQGDEINQNMREVGCWRSCRSSRASRDNHKSQRDQPDGSIGQYRIGRHASLRRADQPEPRHRRQSTMAGSGLKTHRSCCGGRLEIRQRRSGNARISRHRAPRKSDHGDQQSKCNPADIDLAQAGVNCREIDPAKREIKQRQRYQYSG